MIEAENIAVARNGAQILKDVSLTVPAEGITALIGPNGAGKSTLLHVMAGLLAPDAGALRVNGTDILKANAMARARILAVLTQSNATTAHLTISDLVSFGRWPHHRGRPGKDDVRAVADALEAFDLTELATRSIDRLSGGQRQRAFVAMAYAQTTPWMLLDEPLAALDPKVARDIMDRLKAISRPGPKSRAVVVVLHDLAMTARYADHCIALKNGAVMQAGPLRETLTEEMLAELYEADFLVQEVHGQTAVLLR